MTLRTKFPLRKYHPSWLIAWMSAGVLVGTVLSLQFSNFFGLEWLVVAVCLSLIAMVRRIYISIIIIILAGLSLGLWRGGNQILSQSGYGQFFNKTVVVVGRVSEDPSYDTDGDLRMNLVDVHIKNVAYGGRLWAATSMGVEVKRSDVVTITGKLTKGFGNLPAAVYRARVTNIERQDYSDVGRDTRDWFAGGIRKSVREPEASLGSGFLLGQKTALPEKLDSELRLLGLTHIIVASGYNLTILIRIARRFFEKISRFTALAASGGLIYGFLQITGSSPSMARASLIAALSLLMWFYGRKMHPMVLLPFSAAITVLINPAYAWGDIGWLLSFTSFIGVIMLAPLIHAYFWGENKPKIVRQVIVETLSAQLLTLPIIAYVFGQYSPLALVANALILPFIPVAMALTTIAGFAGVILPGGATIIGWPAETLMGYMTTVVDYLAQLPLASSEIVFSINGVIVGYLLMLVVLIYLWRRTGYSFRDYNVIE